MNLLLDLFLTFFKIGAFTFGGGYAMLPMIEQEVMAHKWMAAEEIVDFIAVSESTPGPFAVNVSTYIGTKLAGLPGAAAATLGVIMPSFLIILLIAKGYKKFKDNKTVTGMMSGLRPAVVGLIASALLSVGKTVFFPDAVSLSAIKTGAFLLSLVIFLLAVYLSNFKKMHPIKIILLAAVLGIVSGYAGIL